MKWVLLVVGMLAVLVGAVALIGAQFPREHVASSAITLRQPPDTVWAMVRDLGSVSGWWPEVDSAERLQDAEEREVWRYQRKDRSVMLLVVEEARAPHRLVTRIDAPPNAAFGGTWTYELAAADQGTRLTVTERGWVSNPIFRFMATLVFGLHGTLDSYLTALARRFGELVTPTHIE